MKIENTWGTALVIAGTIADGLEKDGAKHGREICNNIKVSGLINDDTVVICQTSPENHTLVSMFIHSLGCRMINPVVLTDLKNGGVAFVSDSSTTWLTGTKDRTFEFTLERSPVFRSASIKKPKQCMARLIMENFEHKIVIGAKRSMTGWQCYDEELKLISPIADSLSAEENDEALHRLNQPEDDDDFSEDAGATGTELNAEGDKARCTSTRSKAVDIWDEDDFFDDDVAKGIELNGEGAR